MSSNLADFLEDDSFDTVKADTGRPDPIPNDDYTLQLDSYEFKKTKDGTGIMLNAIFKVMEGEYEGRSIFTNYNVRNKSPLAQSIGQGQLAAFLDAIGMSRAEFKEDTASAQFRPFRAKVGLGKASAGYEARNEVKVYYPADGVKPAAPAAKPAAPAAASKPAPAAGPSKVAWAKKQAA